MSDLMNVVRHYGDLSTRMQLMFLASPYENKLHDGIIDQLTSFIKDDELVILLEDFFVTRNETALQNTYAKKIAYELVDYWLPAYSTIEKQYDNLRQIKIDKIILSILI